MNLELNKSIEAKRLNKRTGAPTNDPEVAIPYGAIVENVEPDREFERFTYLRELYRCSHTLLASATDPRAWTGRQTGTPASSAAKTPASTTPKLHWSALDSGKLPLLRAKVPGGWLIAAASGATLIFYPDPNHHWDGASLP